MRDNKKSFSFVSFGAPHQPNAEPARYISKALAKYPVDEGELSKLRWRGDVAERNGNPELSKLCHIASILHLDDAIADLFQMVVDFGKRGETLFLFINDNGGTNRHGITNSNLRGYKGSPFEGAHKTTNFLVGPELKGKLNNKFVWIGDWLPTCADIAGADISDLNLDGESLIRRKPHEEIPPARIAVIHFAKRENSCLLYTSPSPRDQRGSRMPSSA